MAIEPEPVGRIERALAEEEPAETLLELAEELRDRGMPRAGLLALFEAFRERHNPDPDPARYDAILDTMDFISGWCHPSRNLYPDPEK